MVFQKWRGKSKMDEVSGIADQLPLQLCVLGDSLAKDAVFLNICRGFQVAKIYFFDHVNY